VSGIRVLLCERRCTAPSLTGAPGPLTVRGPAGTDRRGACRKLGAFRCPLRDGPHVLITVLVLIAGPESGSAPASVADVPPLSSRSFWSSQAVEQVDAEPGREVLGPLQVMEVAGGRRARAGGGRKPARLPAGSRSRSGWGKAHEHPVRARAGRQHEGRAPTDAEAVAVDAHLPRVSRRVALLAEARGP
jgi:hypothetical protein